MVEEETLLPCNNFSLYFVVQDHNKYLNTCGHKEIRLIENSSKIAPTKYALPKLLNNASKMETCCSFSAPVLPNKVLFSFSCWLVRLRKQNTEDIQIETKQAYPGRSQSVSLDRREGKKFFLKCLNYQHMYRYE